MQSTVMVLIILPFKLQTNITAHTGFYPLTVVEIGAKMVRRG